MSSVGMRSLVPRYIVNKLRELSGALWDEDVCMIVLEEEHYNGHT
jgi:hypothetical protein